MRLNNKILSLISGILCSVNAYSQNIIKSQEYPQDFRPPLDLVPSLAGSFGEIRSNHFHSGLDYRTNQREGYPIYAVADGYVSRLRVQSGGFGNAVYISHPNGYTSVYAHLQRFNTRIGQTIKDLQYRRESFEVDFPLISIEIPVKKGDIIAWSGNTGSSGGPHLHFEIRDTKTEETINPQLFGISVPDNVKPIISGLYMYRLNGLPFTENTPSQYFQLVGANGNYSLNQSPLITFDREVGFGIATHDQQRVGGNRNGVYSIELVLDGKTVFASALERFAFADSRGINSHVDYPALISSGRTIQKSFLEPGNPLDIYPNKGNSGIIALTDDSIHQIKYLVKDLNGNTSTLNFRVQRNSNSKISGKAESPGVKFFQYDDSTTFKSSGMQVSIPKGVLYSDINLKYSTSARPKNSYSAIHNIHTRLVPVHKNYYLWIKPDVTLPNHLRDKAVIADTRGGSHGGVYDNGYIKAAPKTFGNFFIRVDTIAPNIRPINISEGKSLAGETKISLTLADNLSGIRTYRGTIDGQWVLFEYDLKTSTLWHTFDEELSLGKHIFQFTATDMKMNSRTYTAVFYR